MANRILDRIWTLMRGVVLLDGSFDLAGAGAPTGLKGAGYTVARTGTGTFVVTLSDAYFDIVSAKAQLSLAVPAAKMAQVGGVSTAAKTITIVIVDTTTGAAADVAAATHNRVHFQVSLKNSAAKP